MTTRRIGRSELAVKPFCFGGNVFGWTADEAASFRLLDAFVDRGFDFIDTADVYSRWAPGHAGGESETILGRWFAQGGKRNKVVLATKVGMDMGEGRTGLKADYIRRAVDDSLRRLRCDHIDLYQAHRDDEATELEETLEAFAGLIQAGKIRVAGASNYSAPRLEAALATSKRLGLPRYECLQPHYNLVERKAFEAELGPLCAREEIGVIPYYSLASGFLTGKYRSQADAGKSARGGAAAKYLDAGGLKVLAALDDVAGAHGATPAQVALAWSMTKTTAPIASATSPAQLDELLRATELKLTGEDIGRLERHSVE